MKRSYNNRNEGPTSRDQQSKRAKPDAAVLATSPMIFVGQLPFTATQAALSELFGQHGTVKNLRMVRKSLRREGKVKHLFTGVCFVTYASAAEADAAAKALAGTEYEGRKLRSDKAPPGHEAGMSHKPRDPTGAPSKTLFVANLPYNFDKEVLEGMFAKQRGFETVRATPDSIAKGFGYVQFEDVDAAVAAVKAMNGTMFRARPIRLDYANSSQLANVKSNDPAKQKKALEAAKAHAAENGEVVVAAPASKKKAAAAKAAPVQVSDDDDSDASDDSEEEEDNSEDSDSDEDSDDE
ncbi:nuclear localization sequence binding protein [Blastocladiella emersonii ATCC 22665]|nr:nuclear localization sequence binding protein [Blastocladiella emersonii ATCC 22665]